MVAQVLLCDESTAFSHGDVVRAMTRNICKTERKKTQRRPLGNPCNNDADGPGVNTEIKLARNENPCDMSGNDFEVGERKRGGEMGRRSEISGEERSHGSSTPHHTPHLNFPHWGHNSRVTRLSSI